MIQAAGAAEQYTIFPAARPAVALTCAGHGWSLIAGDANADGKADLVAGGPGGVSLMLGTGDGRFAPCKQLDSEPASSIFLADFDGDGTADLLTTGVSSNGPNGMRFLKGAGQGAFATGVTISLPDMSSGASAVGDVNGDGVADVVAASWRFSGSSRLATITTYFGSRTGFIVGSSFDLPLIPDLAGGAPIKSLMLWRSAKGVLQLIVSRDPGTVDTFSMDTGGTLVLSSSQSSVFGSLFVDFNRDGYLDAVRAVSGGGIAVSFGWEHGWLPQTNVSVVPGSFVFAADINEDGYPDLIGLGGGTITISLNRGGTALDPPRSYFVSGGSIESS